MEPQDVMVVVRSWGGGRAGRGVWRGGGELLISEHRVSVNHDI